MKTFFTLIALLLVFANGLIGQTQKTLVKTLALAPNTVNLQLDLPTTIEVQEWDEPTLRLVTTINANVEENVLKALITTGRYGYTTTQLATGVTLIQMPKMDINVTVRGHALEEDLQVLIYIPRNLNYEIVKDDAHHLL